MMWEKNKMGIYLDNASTTFPKPDCVPDAVYNFMKQLGSNINRGTYMFFERNKTKVL